MIQGKTLGIVIPCFNEAEGLRALLPRRPSVVDEVVVVDNNSTDATAAVARQYGARVVFERQPGYGSAYQAGFRAVHSEIISTMDGDGQYDVAEVPRLAQALLARELDLLVASRFPLPRGSMPRTRIVGNRLLTGITRVLFGRGLSDTQSGMWVFRRGILPVVQPTERGMAFSEEFKLKTLRAGLRVGEEHIVYYPRQGKSKLLPLADGWKNLIFLIRLRIFGK